MTTGIVESFAAPIGVGGFVGFLIGYAIRKVIKLIFVLVGLGLAFVLFLPSFECRLSKASLCTKCCYIKSSKCDFNNSNT